MTINQLKTRAKAHDMMIRKDGHGGYLLVDIYTNGLVAPGSMTLGEVGLWLEALDMPQQEK